MNTNTENGTKRSLLALRGFNQNWSSQISLAAALILICIVFSILSPFFFTRLNFVNIGHYLPPFAIMAAGCTVALTLGALDVSQYSNCALVGVLAVLMDRAGVPIIAVFFVCIALGMALGAVNGFTVTVLRLNPIIATLASGMIMRGFCYFFTEGRTFSVTPASALVYFEIGRGTLFDLIPNTLLFMIAVYLIIFVILKYTRFGRNIYAVGGNNEASFLAGINVRATRFGGFVLCGATAGLAGFLILSQLAAFQPNTGEATLMDVIAAVILGGASLSGGKSRLFGTILGVLTLTVIQNGMNLIGLQLYYQMIVRGVIVIVAVYIDVIRGGGFR